MTQKPYFVMNSEFDVYHNGEWAPGVLEEAATLNPAADWIGGLIRNWEAQRSGGEFSQIKDACWLFTIFQQEKDGPIQIHVYTEVGYYNGDNEEGDATGSAIEEALNKLIGAVDGVQYGVKRLPNHESYFLFDMGAEYPQHKDALWEEMLRVTESIKDNPTLSGLRNWIL